MRRHGFALALIILALPSLHSEGSAASPATSAPQGTKLADTTILVGRQASPEGDAEAERFSKALAAAIGSNLLLAGLEAREASTQAASAASLSQDAREAGLRWAILATCSHVGQRVAWTALLLDARDGAILAADAFAAYPGLSALPLVDGSASKIVGELATARGGSARELPVPYALRFSSHDEGALLSIGDFPLGTVAGGKLVAPWLAFRKGQEIVLRIEKDGFHPKDAKVKVGEDREIALPRLVPIRHEALIVDYGLGRILGFGVAYRHDLAGERAYLEARAAPWVAYDFRPGSSAVLHAEAGFGVGILPFFPVDSVFRLGLGLGVSGWFTCFTATSISEPFAFDLVLVPIELEARLTLPEASFIAAFRFPYSVGLDAGLLSQGWLRIGNGGLPFLTLGVVFPW